MNQCWNTVNSDLRNKFQWNIKQNSYIFIQENAFENVCETTAILSLPQRVNEFAEMCAELNMNSKPSSAEDEKIQGAVSIRKTVLPSMAIPMLKIRRPNGRLIFNMEIAIRR